MCGNVITYEYRALPENLFQVEIWFVCETFKNCILIESSPHSMVEQKQQICFLIFKF